MRTSKKQGRWLVLGVIVWSLIVLLLLLSPSKLVNPILQAMEAGKFQYADKVGHLLLFGVLGALLYALAASSSSYTRSMVVTLISAGPAGSAN